MESWAVCHLCHDPAKIIPNQCKCCTTTNCVYNHTGLTRGRVTQPISWASVWGNANFFVGSWLALDMIFLKWGSSSPSSVSYLEFGLPAITCTVNRNYIMSYLITKTRSKREVNCAMKLRVLTCLERVNTVISVELLSSVLFCYSFTQYCILVNKIHGLLIRYSSLACHPEMCRSTAYYNLSNSYKCVPVAWILRFNLLRIDLFSEIVNFFQGRLINDVIIYLRIARLSHEQLTPWNTRYLKVRICAHVSPAHRSCIQLAFNYLYILPLKYVNMRTCETGGCEKEAKLQCPTCLKLGLDNFFCSQVSASINVFLPFRSSW